MARYTINYLTGDTDSVEAEAVNCDDSSCMYVFRGPAPHHQTVALAPFVNVRSILRQDDEPTPTSAVTWTNADEAPAREAEALRLAQERTGIACDMDRLAKWKNELTDALGMDRTRDWDDIRNAARGLRKQRDAQAGDLERLRAGEEPITDEGIAPNPGQWIWQWNRATPEKRLSMAAQIQDGMTRSNNCFMADHEAQIANLRGEVERLSAERGSER